MYKIKLNSKKQTYTFERKDSTLFEGSLVQVTLFAMQQGMLESELTLAFNVMSENLHTIAEFGIRGSFLYSHGGLRDNAPVTHLFH